VAYRACRLHESKEELEPPVPQAAFLISADFGTGQPPFEDRSVHHAPGQYRRADLEERIELLGPEPIPSVAVSCKVFTASDPVIELVPYILSDASPQRAAGRLALPGTGIRDLTIHHGDERIGDAGEEKGLVDGTVADRAAAWSRQSPQRQVLESRQNERALPIPLLEDRSHCLES
jgi:hypothetical protein